MLRIVENPSAPPGKSEKYARVERERRWLLAGPPAVADATAAVVITDHYLAGTRLRLRRSVDQRDREPTIYKLTQKVPVAGRQQGLITNVYLTETEYELLRRLGGDRLVKTRYRVPPFGIDVFDPPLVGLVLAEAEFASDGEADAATAPASACREVTDDERFTGGRLARTSRAQLAALLAETKSVRSRRG